MSICIKLDGTHVVTEDDSEIIQERLASKLAAFDQMNAEDSVVLKSYRSSELFDSDWTQGVDSPLDSSTKTAWISSRVKRFTC